MTARMRGLGVALVALLAGAPTQSEDAPATLSDRAAAWLASLDADQRGDARYDFDDDERFDLRLAPFGLEGVVREDLRDDQWQALRRMLATTLSERGLAKVETIMSLEREVGRRDQESLFGRWLGGFIHGEERYYTSIYGDPGSGGPWGLRFDGHHVSLNWTVGAEGVTSETPLFLGGEPREVPAGWERAGLRVLSLEEDRGLALLRALDEAQRRRSELPFEPASGIAGQNRVHFLGAGERVTPGAPVGVGYAELSNEAQAAFDALIEAYLANFIESVAVRRRVAIDAAGRGELHFAWSGDLTPGNPGYYRVQGPNLLIEFDNTLEAADHVHVVMRDFAGDFARDLLAEHHAIHHDPGRELRARMRGARIAAREAD